MDVYFANYNIFCYCVRIESCVAFEAVCLLERNKYKLKRGLIISSQFAKEHYFVRLITIFEFLQRSQITRVI